MQKKNSFSGFYFSIVQTRRSLSEVSEVGGGGVGGRSVGIPALKTDPPIINLCLQNTIVVLHCYLGSKKLKGSKRSLVPSGPCQFIPFFRTRSQKDKMKKKRSSGKSQ